MFFKVYFYFDLEVVVAESINTAFSGFDYAIMEFGHNLHNQAGGFFDGFMRFITVFGDGGIILILLAIGLIAFKKTRKIGITMLGAIVIGALITNITVKPLVARPRPFYDESSIFYTWWKAAGAVPESGYSFPSGHATASMAAMMAFFLAGNKKYSWTGFILALLIGFSRIYLCVHYPSDVLFGFIVGIIAGSLSFLIVWLAYKYLKDTKLGDILYNKDIITLYNYIKVKIDKNKKVKVASGADNIDTNAVAEKDEINNVENTNNAEITNHNSDNSVVVTDNIDNSGEQNKTEINDKK